MSLLVPQENVNENYRERLTEAHAKDHMAEADVMMSQGQLSNNLSDEAVFDMFENMEEEVQLIGLRRFAEREGPKGITAPSEEPPLKRVKEA